MTISGLGPHGERAAPPERVSLLPEDITAARAATRRVAIVLHTLDSDWTRLQISGMLGIFGDCGVIVVQLVQEEQLRIVRIATDIELFAARFGVARGAGAVGDGGIEGGDVRRLDAEFDDQGLHDWARVTGNG